MNVAFIPVRGGSKSIPLKNIKEMAGHPLVYWAAKAACECKYLDCVYVSTDHEEIRSTVENFGFEKLKVCGRSPNTASDFASTESAMLEFAEKNEFGIIALIQATSPLLSSEDLEKGFEAFFMPDTDSVLSVVRQKRFHWKIEEGFAKAINYDIYHRPMRQDFEGCMVENGALYITSRTQLLKTGNRISGNIRAVEMPEHTYYEIDEISDWEIIEGIMGQKKKSLGRGKEYEIKMFLTDCDGCLTDGGMYYTHEGDEIKKFHTYDGMGFCLLHQAGIITGIVTGEKDRLIERRAEKIGADILEMEAVDKLSIVQRLCKQYGITMENVAYVGDDINDVDVIKAVGFGCAVQNSSEEMKGISDYVTIRRGGEGAVREVIDLLLKSKEVE